MHSWPFFDWTKIHTNIAAEKKTLLEECKIKQKKSEKLIKELEAKTSKSTRETMIKEAEKNVATCKKKAAASQEKYNAFLAVSICLLFMILF